MSCLKYFLRLEIAQSTTSIVFSQRHYTLQLLEDNGYLACKPSSIPMDPKVQLSAHDGIVLYDVSQYRVLIGHFLYLSLILLLLPINLVSFWLKLGYLTCKLFITFYTILSPLGPFLFFIFSLIESFLRC